MSGETYEPASSKRTHIATPHKNRDAAAGQNGHAVAGGGDSSTFKDDGGAGNDGALELPLTWDKLQITLNSLDEGDKATLLELETLCTSGVHDGIDTVIAKGASRYMKTKIWEWVKGAHAPFQEAMCQRI